MKTFWPYLFSAFLLNPTIPLLLLSDSRLWGDPNSPDQNSSLSNDQTKVYESSAPESAYVYEILEYSASFDPDYWAPNLPELGDWIPGSSDLPAAEILSIEYPNPNDQDLFAKNEPSKHRRVKIRIRFFIAGEFLAPVSWKNKEGKIIDSKVFFKILSSLDPNETEDPPLEAPVEFGKFLWHRLFLGLIGLLMILGLASLGYMIWKRKPIEAIVEIRPEVPESLLWEEKIKTFFAEERISKKEFGYLLTEYLRWKLKEFLPEKKSGITDNQWIKILYNSYPVSKTECDTLAKFLESSKYDLETEIWESEKGWEIFSKWKKIISDLEIREESLNTFVSPDESKPGSGSDSNHE